MSRNERNKIVTDSMVLTIGGYLIKMKGLIFMPLIIQTVGMANYGIFVQIFINLAMITPFCTLSLGEGFKRFTSKYDLADKKRLSVDFWSIMSVTILSAFLGGTLIFLLAPTICEYLFKDVSTDVVVASRLSGLMVFERVLWEQINKFLLGQKKFKLNTSLTLLYKFVPYLGLMLGFVVQNSLMWAITYYLILELIFLIILILIVLRIVQFEKPDLSVVKRFLKYSWPLILSNFEGSLLAKVNRYFISFMMGPAAAGVFNIIYSVIALLDEFSLPFRRYFGSYLPKLWDSGNQEKAFGQLRKGIQYFLVISVLGLGGIIILLKPMLIFLIADKMPVIDYFLPLIVITGLGVVSEGAIRLYNQVINLQEKNIFLIAYQMLAVILGILLNYMLIPKLGLLGAGIATFSSYLFVLIINAYMFSVSSDFRYYLKQFTILTTLIPVILWTNYFPAKTLFEGIFYSSIYVLLFVVVMWKLRVLDKSELKIFMRPKRSK